MQDIFAYPREGGGVAYPKLKTTGLDNKSIILTVVLYEYETWSLTLREGIWEQGSEENIWAEEGLGKETLQKTA
jgi:hypothetical protein